LKQISVKIISNEVLTRSSIGTPQVNLVCLEAPEIAAEARPGQFVMISCGPDTMLRRPLSIHHIDVTLRVSFLFVVTGKGTTWLSHQNTADELTVLGPLGNGFNIEHSSKEILLLAGGIGIAPLTFLAQDAINQGKQVILVAGSRTKNQLYKRNLPLDKMKTIILTEDGSDGIKGKISDLPNLLDHINHVDQVFACGPLPMYQALSELIHRKSLMQKVQVSLEVRMGCGWGICYGCSIKTRNGMQMVCKNGPVFNMDEILWDELKL
jgi:dihydroorotate dehydrogenase electron transfer subunit